LKKQQQKEEDERRKIEEANRPKLVEVPQYQPEPEKPVSEVVQGETPKKVGYRPVGGVIMQGFNPMMLAQEALKRREKKNLDSGESEAVAGVAKETEEPKAQWEPTPLASGNNYRKGIGLDVLGGDGMAAAMKKRQEKLAAQEAAELEKEQNK